MLCTGLIQHAAIQLHNALEYFQTDRNQDKPVSNHYQQPKRTTQTIIFDPRPGPRQGLKGEGRVEVTEMIKGFLFCFEIFHHGISLGIGNFGKYKYL